MTKGGASCVEAERASRRWRVEPCRCPPRRRGRRVAIGGRSSRDHGAVLALEAWHFLLEMILGAFPQHITYVCETRCLRKTGAIMICTISVYIYSPSEQRFVAQTKGKQDDSVDTSCFLLLHGRQCPGHQTRTNKEGVSAILSFLRPDLRSSVRIMDFDHLIAIVQRLLPSVGDRLVALRTAHRRVALGDGKLKSSTCVS